MSRQSSRTIIRAIIQPNGVFATRLTLDIVAFGLCKSLSIMLDTCIWERTPRTIRTVVSAIISFVRTLIFEIGAVFLLPLVLGPDGIWYSISVAELAALVMTIAFTWTLAPKYGYLASRP